MIILMFVIKFWAKSICFFSYINIILCVQYTQEIYPNLSFPLIDIFKYIFRQFKLERIQYYFQRLTCLQRQKSKKVEHYQLMPLTIVFIYEKTPTIAKIQEK